MTESNLCLNFQLYLLKAGLISLQYHQFYDNDSKCTRHNQRRNNNNISSMDKEDEMRGRKLVWEFKTQLRHYPIL